MPMDNRTQILSREELFGDDSVSCDLVNISYVLCLLEPEEARSILNELRNGQSNAVFAIVDYTLQNRTRAEVLGLLSAHEEKKWREKLGDDEFVRTHTRFTHKSLCALLRSAGLCPLNEELSSLDPAGIRSAIIAHPQ
jgi:hypothetical protein